MTPSCTASASPRARSSSCSTSRRTATRTSSTTRTRFDVDPQPQPPHRLRRRAPRVHGHQPGPTRDPGPLRGARPAVPGHARGAGVRRRPTSSTPWCTPSRPCRSTTRPSPPDPERLQPSGGRRCESVGTASSPVGQRTVVRRHPASVALVQLLAQGIPGRRPHPVEGAHVVPVARAAPQRALRRPQRSLHGLDDLEHGDLLRRSGEGVPAGRTRAARSPSRPQQLAQHLLEEPGGDVHRLADGVGRDR